MAWGDDLTEGQKWLGLSAILVLALAILGLVLTVVLNAGSILVGTVLIVMQIVVALLLVVGGLVVGLAAIDGLTRKFRELERDIAERLASMGRTIARANNTVGTEFLGLLTGFLTLGVQETFQSNLLLRVSISIAVTVWLWLSAHLVRRWVGWRRVLATCLYLVPIATLVVLAVLMLDWPTVQAWGSALTLGEAVLSAAAVASLLLGLVFALSVRESSG